MEGRFSQGVLGSRCKGKSATSRSPRTAGTGSSSASRTGRSPVTARGTGTRAPSSSRIASARAPSSLHFPELCYSRSSEIPGDPGFLPQTNAISEWARGDMDTRRPLEIRGQTAKPGVTKFRKVQLIASLEWTRADPTGTMTATPWISSHPVVGVSEGRSPSAKIIVRISIEEGNRSG